MKAVMFIIPVFQVLVFGFAISTDVDKVPTAIYDLDNTKESRRLIHEFTYSKYFTADYYIHSDDEQRHLLDKSLVNAVIRINHGFSQDIQGGKSARVQLIVDGTDSNTAAIVLNYGSKIAEKYSFGIAAPKIQIAVQGSGGIPQVDLRTRAWFNENLVSHNFFVPGVIALVVFIVTFLLTAMAIVKEKEIGTMEQIIVSPIRPIELILGKLIPFAIIGIFDVCVVVILALIVFKVPMRGSFLLLFFSSCLFLSTTLGLGLLISTVSKTQQQAMMSMLFLAMPMVLLSGFLFPIANMPKAVQVITLIDPLRYFLVIIRGIFLKGSGFFVLWPQMLALLVLGVAIIGLSSRLFHKEIA